MSIAMFVLAIVFLFFTLATLVCYLLDEYGSAKIDWAIPGVTSGIIGTLGGAALAILAIVNFAVTA